MSGRVTVQSIVQAAYPAYEQTHAVAAHVRRAIWCLRRCGTGALGSYERRCPEGHYRETVGRSCRHRACPRCAWRRGEEWLERWRTRLLPSTHFHTIFTLPSQLYPLWRYHRERLAQLLLAAAWATLREVLGHPQWEPLPGVLPGVLMALHTWNRALLLHPHVHCLVTAGGLDALGQWVAIERAILAPASVLRTVFRGKLLHAVRRAGRRGELVLPPGWTAGTLKLAREAAAKRTWNVRAELPYRHGTGLVIYLARYVCGGSIGDRRLVAFDGKRVTFVVGREPHDPRTATLPGADFIIRRLSEHIPQSGQRLTRAYGLYASTRRAQLATVRAQLASTAPPAALSAPPPSPRAGCPVCGQPLELIDLTSPLRRRTRHGWRSTPRRQPQAVA